MLHQPTVPYDSKVLVTVHLGRADTNRNVSIYAKPFGSAHQTLLKKGNVGSKGTMTVSYRAAHSTTFIAVTAGNTHFTRATVRLPVRVLAKVSATLGGYYGSQTIHGTTYRLYHPSSRVDVAATVTPNKHGQCAIVEAQEYYQGKWNPNVMSGCLHLSRSSAITGYLSVVHADKNIPYRVRVDYDRSASDTTNLSTDSVWQYLMVKS